MTEEFPADWYDDPNAPGGRVKRYWNGSAWTEHVFDTHIDPASTSPGSSNTTNTHHSQSAPLASAPAPAAQEPAATPSQESSAAANAGSNPSASSPPAGWYDDPTTGLQRYWDGNAWTEHTHDPQQRTPEAESLTDSANAAESRLPDDATSVRAATGSQEAEAEPQKIGMFGARKAAKQLSEVNQELRDRISTLEATVAKYGLLDLAEQEEHLIAIARQVADAKSELASLRAENERLNASLIESRDTVALQEMGIFDYEHPAEHSATLATQLEALRHRIKQTNKIGSAIELNVNFTYNNSVAKGRAFGNQMSRIMLRAYNAEAENAVKRVRAGNLAAAQKRLSMAATQIEKQGKMIDLRISEGYHALRLQELELAARHLQVLAHERELERERKAELREQNAFAQEAKRERERLDKERAHYINAARLMREQGNEEGALDVEEQLARIDKDIEELDYRVANIRAGYVYIISNVGSFGEGVVKIGMTRRLDPRDRVKELGDASVPFRFDTHALFFSDDAVEVEAMLHRHFARERINRVNSRKEFFRVEPAAVLEALKEHQVAVVEFNTDTPAEEYRLSWPGEATT